MKEISTKKAPAAIGPYSQAIQVGGLVYTSGQLPINPETGAFVPGGIKEQTRQSLTNVKAVLNGHEQGSENHRFFGGHGRFRRHEQRVCRVLLDALSRPFGCRS